MDVLNWIGIYSLLVDYHSYLQQKIGCMGTITGTV